MSAADGSEPGGAGEGPDPKADEEERYRLKIAVLQEYYDAIALQTVRLRERIYQVKKQCRRLEVMKRVALNMLHQNTGTYEIPPLEIVDEPSRSKSDGKLTPEEEERAKQKICSIIDSVYSETAKRMGDTPKRPVRSISAMGSSSEKMESHDVTAEQCSDDGCRASGLYTSFNGQSEAYMEETDMNGSSMAPYAEADLDPLVKLTYNSLLPEQRTQFGPADGSTQSIRYHNMSTALYNGAISYGDSVDKAQSYAVNMVNTVCNTPLDTIQPLDYIDGEVAVDLTSFMGSSGLPPHYKLLHGTAESSAIYTNAATDASTSVTMSCNENLNPATALDYQEGTTLMPTNFLAVAPEEIRHCSGKATVKSETRSSPVGFSDSKETAQSTVATKAIPVEPSEEASPVKGSSKQKTSLKTSNNCLPPPNYIPYRMIAVETSKQVEVVSMGASGDEVTPSKPPPKRRRKYKYVVESVLDNVPYTFRQAESDDDEATEKHNASANESRN
ncbi:hypothetical protein GCK32_009011 [Trichostrongylus colubriformis]|uniref:Uncharacterized protein n=1 Tax=Trichostrongylus colubriformis TaxID=6319 RepID=A0AAN8EW20_TRICO